jgi:prophage antirepressor-like protein
MTTLDEEVIQMIKDFTVNPKIRTIYMDDDHYMSAGDVTTIVTGLKYGSALDKWNDLFKENEKEWIPYMKRNKFPKAKQKTIIFLNTEGVYRLVMILTGRGAIKTRLHIVDRVKKKLQGQGHAFRDVLHESLEKRAIENENEQEQTSIEYIYATASDAFPGLIKIGRTQDVEKRLSSANTFCAPMPHRLLFSAPTMHSVRDEMRVHDFFKERHVAGEFFRVTPAEVEDCLRNLVDNQS